MSCHEIVNIIWVNHSLNTTQEPRNFSQDSTSTLLKLFQAGKLGEDELLQLLRKDANPRESPDGASEPMKRKEGTGQPGAEAPPAKKPKGSESRLSV